MIRDGLPIASGVVTGAVLLFPVLKAAHLVELAYLDAVNGWLKLLTYGPFIIVGTTFFLVLLFGVSLLAALTTKYLIEYADNR